jgi:NAD(P)-dependent dehydrogenase (short-subunit alcohol dehydrogenase family)
MMKAVVTGASKGLGLAIARELYKQGVELILIGRDQKDFPNIVLNELKGSDGYFIDLSDHEDLMSLFRETENLYPDILVNCAGQIGPIGPFVDTEWKEWTDTLYLDLTIPVRLCWHFLPRMIRRKYGKIINISGGGATKGMPNFSAYASAKTALVRFTETLAAEVEQYHIYVNAVSPGAMYSAITEQIIEAGQEKAGLKAYDEACQTKDYNRGPEEAARLVAFLASHESDGITGRLISAVHDPWEGLKASNFALNPDRYTLRRQV